MSSETTATQVLAEEVYKHLTLAYKKEAERLANASVRV